jgi:hypothetical protein
MSNKHPKFFIALWLSAAIVLTSAGAKQSQRNEPGPLMIEEQGSFAVGGSVITAPGTFDPIKQGAFNPAGNNPAGQTLHGDHAYVFYQVPVNARNFRSFSGTATGNPLRRGRQPRTVARGSKTFSCAAAFRST